VAGISLILIFAFAVIAADPRRRTAIMRTLKKRAALVVVVGLGVMAWSLTVAPYNEYPETLFSALVSKGYATLFGAALALLGSYLWITNEA
jgi:multisubunit Na+/H+ antiporter MnhB subunit